jgi:hypothetical protein
VAYAVIAAWTARPDEVEEVARCLDAPLYEQYADEGAFEAHVGSAHFQELALEDGIPRLSARERQFLVTVGE